MASVTFPTRLGGSGVTISDDADPNTGLLNGGHRDRFVPGLQGAVDMASYVYQYAAKIDGAAEDAERAQEARAYVETVTDAVHDNLLSPFRSRATLDVDFRCGLYRLDDGNVIESTQLSDLFTYSRSSSKWVCGPDGYLREVTAGLPARTWDIVTGRSNGVLIEGSATNIAPTLFTYGSSATYQADESVPNPLRSSGNVLVTNADDPFSIAGTRNTLAANIAIDPGKTYTVSVFLRNHPEGASRILSLGYLDGTRVYSDGVVFSTTSWTRHSFTVENTANAQTLQVRFAGQGGNDESVRFYAAALQCEEGLVATSFIPSGGTPTTRDQDKLERTLTREFRAHAFTLYWEGESIKAGFNWQAVKIADSSDSAYQGIGIQFSSTGDTVAVICRSDAGTSTFFSFASKSWNRIALSFDASTGTFSGACNGISLSEAVRFDPRKLQRLMIGGARRISGDYDNQGPQIGNTALLSIVPSVLNPGALIALTALPEEVA